MAIFELNFPRLSNGRPKGVNSSGIAAFKGNIAKSLAREWAQNAIDANHNGWPVELDFELKDMRIEDMPGLCALEASLKSCAEYWKDDKQATHFCKNALKLYSKKSIPVLIVSDRGTTGLCGGDKDRHGQWFGLVESTETSVGGEGRGGSYGIGKNAAFAASFLQTVYFSSLSVKGEYAFKGVSILMTHKDGSGEETQPDGAIGISCPETGRTLALRNSAEIPDMFQRSEPGLTTYIPGYKPVYNNPENWQDDLVISLLNNFWPAIHFGKISFKVQDVLINSTTLSKLMDLYSKRYEGNDEEFDAHWYYRVFTSANSRTFKGELSFLKEVTLYAVKEDAISNMPNNVVLTRKNGMKIKYDTFRQLGFPFAGLLVCENDIGNRILRAMEPPQHNDLHPEQLEEADGKAVLKELHSWIRNCLQEFKPKLDKEEYDLPEIAKYFPSPQNEENPLENVGDNNQPDENFNMIPQAPIVISTVSVFTPPTQTGDSNEPGGEGKRDENGLPNKPGTGREKSDHERPGGGEHGELKECISRGCYLGSGRYSLIIRTKEDFSGKVCIYASGDSVSRELLIIKKAHLSTSPNQPLAISDGKIIDLPFKGGAPTAIELTLEQADRYALEVEARK